MYCSMLYTWPSTADRKITQAPIPPLSPSRCNGETKMCAQLQKHRKDKMHGSSPREKIMHKLEGSDVLVDTWLLDSTWKARDFSCL